MTELSVVMFNTESETHFLICQVRFVHNNSTYNLHCTCIIQTALCMYCILYRHEIVRHCTCMLYIDTAFYM